MTRVSEETRLAMERLTRELRQATQVLRVALPASPGGATALTFWTDFNGNGVQDLKAADPEVLTYRWRHDTQRLTLTDNDASGTATTQPVLAARISNYTLHPTNTPRKHDPNGERHN